jgi:TolA-binding protein
MVSPAASAGNVEQAVKDIRNATDARRAGEIYVSVARSAPESAELRDVYVRKMLEFGQLTKAFSPAKALVKLDPSNGVAWAVVGAKSTSTTEAFSATVRAASLLAGDANVMKNLGQLVCWYEHETESEKPPKVEPEVMKIFEANREAWGSNEAFKAGFDRRQKGYDAHQKAVEGVEKSMEQTKADVEDIKGQLEEVEEKIAECRARIKELEEELRVYSVTQRDKDGKKKKVGRVYGDRTTMAEVTRQRTRLGELANEKKTLIGQGKKLGSKYRKLEGTLAKTKRNEKGPMRDADADFKFAAPASVAVVEGASESDDDDPVAEDDDDTAASDDDEAADESAALAAAEKAAGKLLKRAKLYLKNNMNDKAKTILQDIVDEYGSTASGAEAKKLLKDL